MAVAKVTDYASGLSYQVEHETDKNNSVEVFAFQTRVVLLGLLREKAWRDGLKTVLIVAGIILIFYLGEVAEMVKMLSQIMYVLVLPMMMYQWLKPETVVRQTTVYLLPEYLVIDGWRNRLGAIKDVYLFMDYADVQNWMFASTYQTIYLDGFHSVISKQNSKKGKACKPDREAIIISSIKQEDMEKLVQRLRYRIDVPLDYR